MTEDLFQHKTSRREFITTGAVALGGLAFGGSFLEGCGPGSSSSTSVPITVGNIQDLTGNLNIYGIQQHQATQLAIDDINKHSGVLGRQLKLVFYDAQSSLALYTQYATTLIEKNKAQVIVAGLTSASREAIRPIMDRHDELYFYCALYEGGVCDRNVFLMGTTPSQQFGVMIPWAIKNLGKTFYTVAPDYNFGTISAAWVKKYVEQNGGQLLGQEFLPLSTSNFGVTINKLETLKPDVVVALPVGANQTGFFAQFAAAGLKSKMHIISSNYGSGNQQEAISPQAGEGIYAIANYFPQVQNPANTVFKKAWQSKFGNSSSIISEANDTWNAWHLWAKGVNKAGSLDRNKVLKALESGLTFDAPEGTVALEGTTHHLTHTMHIARGNASHSFDIVETFRNVKPAYEEQVCDLVKKPDVKKQFTP
jgi:branched-chain amino acid transport system substrate-binding protein